MAAQLDLATGRQVAEWLAAKEGERARIEVGTYHPGREPPTLHFGYRVDSIQSSIASSL